MQCNAMQCNAMQCNAIGAGVPSRNRYQHHGSWDGVVPIRVVMTSPVSV
jgi:hypothetical protein